MRWFSSRLISGTLLAFGCVTFAACTTESEVDEDGFAEIDEESEDARVAESALTNAERDAVCNAIPKPRPWTKAEFKRLQNEVVTRYVALKRSNDALIAQRGVGGYAGARTEIWKAISLRNDRAAAASLLRSRLKPGYDANQVAREMQGTSCIGRVYEILKASYQAIGRGDEWAPIERCGRAWNSDGLHVQQALIKNGWPSPTLGLATDVARAPGTGDNASTHNGFLTAQRRGSYYGTPVSTKVMLKDFMPTPGSSTRKDEALLLQIGRSDFLSVGTLRGAYHVPMLVPARLLPTDLAPRSGAARTAWLRAHERNEPFVLESHSLRQPWDPTNFEIRPLTDVIGETMTQSVIYSTGTLLMAPHSEVVVPR